MSKDIGLTCLTSSYIGVLSFHNSWVDPLLWFGCRHTLEQSDLYAHPQEADSERLLGRFNRYPIMHGYSIEKQWDVTCTKSLLI